MCETEIKIAYIKKHAYKDREETTHVEVGEEKHTSSSYMKISTMYVVQGVASSLLGLGLSVLKDQS